MSFDSLAKVVTIRPLDRWPGPRTAKPTPSPFEASWRSTVELLDREVRHLRDGNEKAVLQLDVTESQLRNDGLPYANAKIRDRGVILTVPSKHGQLTYPCDTFTGRGYRNRMEDWQHNLRAIALGLEALRKVQRYGIADAGQQYAGWKQLPGPGETGGVDPLRVLEEWADRQIASTGAVAQVSDYELDGLYRLARSAAHPDREGGSHEAFVAVQQAAQQLGVA